MKQGRNGLEEAIAPSETPIPADWATAIMQTLAEGGHDASLDPERNLIFINFPRAWDWCQPDQHCAYLGIKDGSWTWFVMSPRWWQLWGLGTRGMEPYQHLLGLIDKALEPFIEEHHERAEINHD